MSVRIFGLLAVAFALLLGPAAEASDKALALCRDLEASGLFEGPCEISSAQSTVTVRFSRNPRQARSLCQRASGLTSGARSGLAGWTLNIYSGQNTDGPIAVCDLF